MPEIQVQAGPAIATKFAADGEISGWLVRYGEIDTDGETFAVGSFAASLNEIKAAGHRVPLLWQHRLSEPIGSWGEFSETSEGIFGRARINADTAKGREALSLVTKGDLSGLSVGFVAPAEWRRGMTILQAKLYEGSLVSIPAAPKARLRVKDFDSLPALADAFMAGQPFVRRDAEWVSRLVHKALAADTPELEPDPAMTELANLVRSARADLKGFLK